MAITATYSILAIVLYHQSTTMPLKIHWKRWTTLGDVGDLPNSNGVYVIAEPSDEDAVFTRYVGKGNIRKRIIDHMSDSEPNSCLAKIMRNKVVVRFVVLSKIDLDDVEHTVYRKYKNAGRNLCNRYEPAGTMITELNLPFRPRK